MSGGGDGGDGGFLSRWSRRKRAAAAPPAPSPLVAPARPDAAPSDVVPSDAAPPGAAAPPLPLAEAAPAFDPAGLPPVESLTADSDFAAFLREGVPAALRSAALRRAWSLDTAIRDFVGPADYAWDFNAAGSMPGFSLALPDNVDRLLAQIVGPGPSPAATENGDEGAPTPPLAMEAVAPPQAPELEQLRDPGAGPPAVEAEARGEGEPVPEALPNPSAVLVDPAPARRRHGGALPT